MGEVSAPEGRAELQRLEQERAIVRQRRGDEWFRRERDETDAVLVGKAPQRLVQQGLCLLPDFLAGLFFREGPGFALYALMDFIIDQYFPAVDMLEDQLEEIEEQIFEGGDLLPRATTGRIYRLKRDLLQMKRAVSPLIDVTNRVMRVDDELVPEQTRLYFRDVYDHVIRINEMIDTLRELLTTALEANLSLISVSQRTRSMRTRATSRVSPQTISLATRLS